jgi:pimeloyl-ACP methyl ester carboxylesterase
MLRKWLTPANLPDGMTAKDFWQEATFSQAEIDNFSEIVDQGSQTTLVCFSGLALGFAGLPSFEFRKSLQAAEKQFNLVFLRDIRRFWYHLTPEGKSTGLDFYTDQIQAIQEKLGAKRLITLGVSAGGYAALYFGQRLGAEGILAFSPQTNLQRALNWDWGILRGLSKGWLKEQAMIAAVLRRRTRLLQEKMPMAQWGDLTQVQNPNPNTKIHVYYCQENWLDTREASTVNALKNVSFHGCTCSDHNVAGYLRERGELFSRLMESVGTTL